MDLTLKKLEKTNKIISVMGDFNINLLGYESDSDTNDFINTMVSHYLLPYILHPTRVTDHSATIIDTGNIFSNVCEFETISGNIMAQLAGHFAQFLIMRKTNVQYKNCSYLQRDYSKFDKDKSIADFLKLSRDNLSCTNLDVNEKFAVFYQNVLACVDKHVPLKKFDRKSLSFRSKPWISNRIKRMISKRDKYLRSK